VTKRDATQGGNLHGDAIDIHEGAPAVSGREHDKKTTPEKIIFKKRRKRRRRKKKCSRECRLSS
jgi:hypothetical protein